MKLGINKSQYLGIKLVKLLKGQPKANLMSVSVSLDENYEFICQIVLRLRRAGVLRATRGPGGGYEVVRPLNKETLAKVLEYSSGTKSKFYIRIAA